MSFIPTTSIIYYQNFVFDPVIVSTTVEKRKLINFLPAILQTQTLNKFFGSTVDHLFQPGNSISVTGYIGSKPSYWNPATEYYVGDLTPSREFYQLEPCMSTTDSSNNINNFLFYPDLVDVLETQGSYVDNHQRLFEEEYWTWVPPINLDMFTNYKFYYWMPQGLPIIELRGHLTSFTCDGSTSSFNIKPVADGTMPADPDFAGMDIPTDKNFIRVKVNGTNVPFTYISGVVSLNSAPSINSIVNIWIPSDFNNIIGSPSIYFTNEFSLSTGMKIVILNDKTPSFNDRVYIVDGVGTSIFLTVDENYVLDSIVSDLPTTINGHQTTFYGDGSTTTFNIKPIADGTMPADLDFAGMVIPTNKTNILVNVNNEPYTSFTYSNGVVTISPAVSSDVEINIWIASDFDHAIIGWQSYSFINGPTIESYTQYLIKNDYNTSLNGKIFVVINVGSSIVMYPYDDPNNLIGLSSDYIVMERGSIDNNKWSRYNRWFHKSLLNKADKITYQSNRALRPIICFNRNLELYKSGLYKRDDVNLISTEISDITNALSNDNTYITTPIDGQDVTAQWVFGLPNNTCRLLLLSDTNSTYNNRIYNIIATQVSYDVTDPLYIQLSIVLSNDGIDPAGAPVYGEVVEVLDGVLWKGKRVYYNGTIWTSSIQKTQTNQIPIFQLYDINGNRLDDSSVYPQSTFSGNPLFNYLYDSTKSNAMDTVLNRYLTYDKTGNILFQNYLPLERYYYILNSATTEIPGYYYSNIYTKDISPNILSNDWWGNKSSSFQWLNEETVIQNDNRFVNFSSVLQPEHYTDQENNILNTVYFQVSINGNLSKQNINWLLDTSNNRIIIVESLASSGTARAVEDGDRIVIRSVSFVTPFVGNYFYEIPLNLRANPTNEYISNISYYDVADHFSSVILNQTNFTGFQRGTNNWRDSPQDYSKGGTIIQNSASLLRVMLLSSINNLNWVTINRWVGAEYTRYRAQVEQVMEKLLLNNTINSTYIPAVSLNLILKQMNIGKNNTFPFYSSGMGKVSSSSPATFMPPTPAYMGITPIYTPKLYLDTSLPISRPAIQGHDGSIITGWGNTIGADTDYRNLIILQLEQMIYNSIPSAIKSREKVLLDQNLYVGNACRTGDYSWTEFQNLLRPNLDIWAASNNVDMTINTTYNETDPFTWNYVGCVDWKGRTVPGYWRIMYEWLFGTDAPNLRPWEMLGFGSIPSWWTQYYGIAPYTSNNTRLWNDIENGNILGGNYIGINLRFARPGLTSHLPVDNQGMILDPYTSGIIPRMPDPTTIDSPWSWKGGSPAESSWKRTVSYSFALSEAIYLTKPAKFIELYWTSEYVTRIFEGTSRSQLAIGPKGWRQPFSQHAFFGDTNLYYPVGIQEYLFDWYVHKGISTTNLSNWIRSLQSQLGYKVGGFCNYKDFNIISDTSGILASEDFIGLLYSSPDMNVVKYSGVIIQWTGYGFLVRGYDSSTPIFPILPILQNGNCYKIDLGTTKQVDVPVWKKDTYYTQGTIVIYSSTYYRCITSYTSGAFFESNYWIEIPIPQYYNFNEFIIYLDPDLTQGTVNIPYGQVFYQLQDVINFIQGYSLWLQSQGWSFDYVSSDNNVKMDWIQGIKEFLGWSQNSWDPGNFIVISPSANFINYKAPSGMVDTLQNLNSGTPSLLDRNGMPIDINRVEVLRDENSITITPLDSNVGIFSAYLTTSEYEHIIAFDNQTTYGDWLYHPLLNVKQVRLRLEGDKTTNWNGTVEAPGFIVNGNVIFPNFEKSADNFRYYFDIEKGEDLGELKKRARANLGYIKKTYFTDLLFGDITQFEFYQGMIQQKGTASSMLKILRSSFINQNNNIKLLEEWAVRVGDYGGTNIQDSLDINFVENNFINDPQLIEIDSMTPLEWNQSNILSSQTVSTTYNISQVFSGSGIKTIVIKNKGELYTFVPKVSVSGNGIGTLLSADMDWSASYITSVAVINGGSGYFGGDIITFTGSGYNGVGRIKSNGVDWARSIISNIEILDGGAGYVLGDQVVFSNTGGGFGANAVVSKVDTNGFILELNLISYGMKYRPGVQATITPNKGGRVCALKVNITGANIILGNNSIEIIYGGSGYAPNPISNFIGSNGVGAILKVEISGGSVAGINIDNPGTGWFSIPPITIDNRETSQSTALANPATAVVTELTDPLGEIYTLLSGINPGDIFIDKINISSATAFSGSEPLFSLGDMSNYQSIIPNRLLTKPIIINKAFDIETPLFNTGYDISIIFTNIGLLGELNVDILYHYTDQYYNNILTRDKEQGNIIKVVDLYDSNTNKFIHRSSYWEWRYKPLVLNWKTQYMNYDDAGMLPTAGYVHLDDVQKVSNTYNDLLLMWDYLRGTTSPPNIITYNTTTVKYSRNQVSDLSIPVSYNLTGRFTGNIFRLRKITVNIIDPFAVQGTTKPTISFGYPTNHAAYADINKVNISMTGTYEVYPSMWIYPPVGLFDNSVYAYINQYSTAITGTGNLTIQIEVESIDPTNMLVWQNVWVYADNNNDWNVYKLIDSNSKIYKSWSPCNPQQGTVIGLQSELNMIITDLTIINSGSGYSVGDQIGIQLSDGTYKFIATVSNVSSAGSILGIYFYEKNALYTSKSNVNIFSMADSIPGLNLWGSSSSVTDTNDAGTYSSTTYCPYSNNKSTPVIPQPLIPHGAIITAVYTTVIDGKVIIVDGFKNESIGKQGVVRAGTSNYAVVELKPGSTTSTSSQVFDILSILPEAGTTIDKITVTVATPFSEGSQLWIGTNFANGGFFVQPQVDPNYPQLTITDTTQVPPAPAFSYGTLPEIDIYDSSVIVLTPLPNNVPVRVIRTGDIFMTPTGITITNPGSGYDINNPPNISIITTAGSSAPGPSGVTAIANLVGIVDSITVLTNGNNYNTNTTVLISGGGGTGATAQPVIENGQITSITVTNAGKNYTSSPTITVVGGNGSGATAQPVMNYSVQSATMTSPGNCSWDGPANSATIVIDPPPSSSTRAITNVTATGVIQTFPSSWDNTTQNWYDWKWQRILPSEGITDWSPVSRVYFSNPGSVGNNSDWLTNMVLAVTDDYPDQTFNIEIVDIGPSTSTATLGTYTSTIRVVTDLPDARTIDITKAGTKVFPGRDYKEIFNISTYGPIMNPWLVDVDSTNHLGITESPLIVRAYLLTSPLNSSSGQTHGIPGSATVRIDYSYTSGFELFKLNEIDQIKIPFVKTNLIRGGNVLEWSPRRMENIGYTGINIPSSDWAPNDTIWTDDYRLLTGTDRTWDPNISYDYGSVVLKDGNYYQCLCGGKGLSAVPVMDHGTIGSIKVNYYGTYYTKTPKFKIFGSRTKDPKISILLNLTNISSVKVLNGGTGYSTCDILDVISEDPDIEYHGAAVRIGQVDSNGTILSIDVVSPGQFFYGTPTINISNTYGLGAVLEVVLNPVSIANIAINYEGAGFTSTPIIVFEECGSTIGKWIYGEWAPTNQQKLWGVYGATLNTPVSWSLNRIENKKVIDSYLINAEIYDKETENEDIMLHLWDPVKGYIPGIAKRELTYTMEIDPAYYTNGIDGRDNINLKLMWGPEKETVLWWDLSTARYLDYEIDNTTIDYRWKHWGSLAPGISIDVYEWVRSFNPPSSWDGSLEWTKRTGTQQSNISLGQPYRIADGTTPYSMFQEWDSSTNNIQTVYYFWVQNVEWIYGKDRKLSATQVANIIQNPSSSNIPWFAVIDSTHVIVGGIKGYLTNSTALKVTWKLTNKTNSTHLDWKIIRNNDALSTIPQSLWLSLQYSLVGWDALKQSTVISIITTELFVPGQTQLTVIDTTGLPYKGILKYGTKTISYNYYWNNILYGVNNIYGLPLSSGSILTYTATNELRNIVPDPMLSKREQSGILRIPRQSWFKEFIDSAGATRVDYTARQEFIDILNRILYTEPMITTRYDWEKVFGSAFDPAPSIDEYNLLMPDLVFRNEQAFLGLIKPGQTILIDNLPNWQGFWTLWRYEPQNIDSDSYGFLLIDVQKWRIQEGELWNRIDWYAPGWSSADYPTYTFETIADRTAEPIIPFTLLKGTLALIKDNGTGNWQWDLYGGAGTWTTVAVQNGTVEIISDWNTSSNVLWGKTSLDPTTILNRDMTWELEQLFLNIQSNMLKTQELNQIFFALLNYVFTQFEEVDWAFKTSFLYISDFAQTLTQSPLSSRDLKQQLLEYFDDVKPYHTKIREFVPTYTNPVDISNYYFTDFDKPVYPDYSSNKNNPIYRTLDDNNITDQLTLKSTKPWSDYWSNRNNTNKDLNSWNSNWYPIRTLNTSIVFDRVSCTPVLGWDKLPWDSSILLFKGLSEPVDKNKLLKQWQVLPPTSSDYNYSSGSSLPSAGNTLKDVFGVTGQTSYWRWNGSEWKPFDFRYFRVDKFKELTDLAGRNSSQPSNNPLIQTGDLASVNYETNPYYMWNGTEWVPYTDSYKTTYGVIPPTTSDYTYISGTQLPVSGFIVDFFTLDTISYYRWNGETWIPFYFRILPYKTFEDLTASTVSNSKYPDSPILQTGDIAQIEMDDTKFIWTGNNWIQFYATGWDTASNGGLADRIELYYKPTGSNPQKDYNTLISGCDYRGTIVNGGNLLPGLWGKFGWNLNDGSPAKYRTAHYGKWGYSYNDQVFQTQSQRLTFINYVKGTMIWVLEDNTQWIWTGGPTDSGNLWRQVYGAGWGNEFTYYVGNDVDIIGRQFALNEAALPDIFDNATRLVQIPTINVVTGTYYQNIYNPASIALRGGDFIQPSFESGRPEEKVMIQSRNPFSLTMYQKEHNSSDSYNQTYSPPSYPVAYRMFIGADKYWINQRLVDNDLSLATSLTNKSTVVDVLYSGNSNINSLVGNVLYDPMKPNPTVLQFIQNNWKYVTSSTMTPMTTPNSFANYTFKLEPQITQDIPFGLSVGWLLNISCRSITNYAAQGRVVSYDYSTGLLVVNITWFENSVSGTQTNFEFVPQIAGVFPGYIWVGAELIEYWDISVLNNNTIRLGVVPGSAPNPNGVGHIVKRGVKGTSYGQSYDPENQIYSGDGTTVNFNINDNPYVYNTWLDNGADPSNICVSILQSSGNSPRYWKVQNLNLDYTLQYINDVWMISFINPPAALGYTNPGTWSTNNILIQTNLVVLKSTYITHKSGVPIYNAGLNDIVPFLNTPIGNAPTIEDAWCGTLNNPTQAGDRNFMEWIVQKQGPVE